MTTSALSRPRKVAQAQEKELVFFSPQEPNKNSPNNKRDVGRWA